MNNETEAIAYLRSEVNRLTNVIADRDYEVQRLRKALEAIRDYPYGAYDYCGYYSAINIAEKILKEEDN